MTPPAQFLRRDEHPTAEYREKVAVFVRRDDHKIQPVIYRFGGRLFRCSEAELVRMKLAHEIFGFGTGTM